MIETLLTMPEDLLISFIYLIKKEDIQCALEIMKANKGYSHLRISICENAL